MEFRRHVAEARIRLPGAEDVTRVAVETREDPLTGHTARLLPAVGLLPRSSFDIAALAESTRPTCPFCPERILEVTPRFPDELVAGGRVTRGEAVLFPNLLAYSAYATVSVYSPARHHLGLADFTARLVADNLATQVAFLRALSRHDPAAAWTSINANYLLPSGSSVFHPHLQGAAHPLPTTAQRTLAGVPADRYRAYLHAERDAGERYIADTGRVAWLAAFAPVGPAELRGFVPGVACPALLDDATVDELAAGVSACLAAYDRLGLTSFNLALYGAPPDTTGYPLTLRLVARANLDTLYRSDVTWLERLHGEAATDVVPEDLAELARREFAARR